MSKFPKNSGAPITRKKAHQEEFDYQQKYPQSTSSFDFDLEALLDQGKEAKQKGASQYYFINGLDRKGNNTLHLGFIDESGKWVVKPSKIALKQRKKYEKDNPNITHAYGWGIDTTISFLTKKSAKGADIATCCHAINDEGANTLVLETGSETLSLKTSEPEDEELDQNVPVLCPPLCAGGED